MMGWRMDKDKKDGGIEVDTRGCGRKRWESFIGLVDKDDIRCEDEDEVKI